jgi:hypothetical protein
MVNSIAALGQSLDQKGGDTRIVLNQQDSQKYPNIKEF